VVRRGSGEEEVVRACASSYSTQALEVKAREPRGCSQEEHLGGMQPGGYTRGWCSQGGTPGRGAAREVHLGGVQPGGYTRGWCSQGGTPEGGCRQGGAPRGESVPQPILI